MDDQSPEDRLEDFQRQRLESCRGLQFVRKTFASYPSLRSLEPGAWDKQHAYHVTEPYTGQEFDPERFEIVEGGWDHEHCYACNARIEPGDEYWQCVEPYPLELCLACQPRLAAEG